MNARPRKNTTKIWACWFVGALIAVILHVGPAWEAYLNIALRKMDFEQSQLNQEIRELREKLHDLQTHLAQLEDLDSLEAKAARIGLVPPALQQVEVVALAPTAQETLQEWTLAASGANVSALPTDGPGVSKRLEYAASNNHFSFTVFAPLSEKMVAREKMTSEVSTSTETRPGVKPVSGQ